MNPPNKYDEEREQSAFNILPNSPEALELHASNLRRAVIEEKLYRAAITKLTQGENFYHRTRGAFDA